MHGPLNVKLQNTVTTHVKARMDIDHK